MPEKTEQVAVRLPVSLHRRIKQYVKAKEKEQPGLTKAHAIRILLERALREEGMPPR